MTVKIYVFIMALTVSKYFIYRQKIKAEFGTVKFADVCIHRT